MTEDPKKSRLAHVPSILAGSAALIAALSTLYVNLRNDSRPESDPAATTPAIQASATAQAGDSPSSSTAPGKPQPIRLRLDRIQVDNDGSAGSTDWTFQVSVGGEPMFSVPMESLNDKPGKNLARPADPQQASAEVQLLAGKNVSLSVNGWKKGWMPGADAEVSGEAWMSPAFNKPTITLKSGEPKGPQFVLYFSATPAE